MRIIEHVCNLRNYDLHLQVIKTRLQLQGELVKQGVNVKIYRGVLHAFYQVGKHDGMYGLQKGLVPAIGFQFVLNFFRYVRSVILSLEMKNKIKMNFIHFTDSVYSILYHRLVGRAIVMVINHFGLATFGVA